MLLLTLNFKKRGCLFHCWKGQPLALMVSLLLLRLGLCILGHPSHAGHRVRSSARLPLSISLFGPVRPCVPLKTTSSIGPISVGLALPKRKAGPFLRSAAAIPAGVFAPCSAGSARISLAHGRILSKLRFGIPAPPVFPCANRLCFLGSVPSLCFGGARFARFRFSILDVPFGLFPCSHPAALFPMGFASMRPLRPKLPPSWGSMQISDLWGLRFETHSHFRILAGFGIALCRLSGLGAIPLAVGGRRIRAYPFSSGVHRFLAPLRPCPLFLPLPAEILRLAFRKKAGLWKKSSRRVFCLISRGPPPRLCRHCARGGDLSAMPVSFNCRVLPIFWMLRPARFPGLCPCASAHPGLAGRVPISGFPLDRSCSQPRSFARPAACGFFAVRRLLRIAA